jgi:hypothetical protein
MILDAGSWMLDLRVVVGMMLDVGYWMCAGMGVAFCEAKSDLYIQYPASSYLASSIQHPASRIQYLVSSIQDPASNIQYPTSSPPPAVFKSGITSLAQPG